MSVSANDGAAMRSSGDLLIIEDEPVFIDYMISLLAQTNIDWKVQAFRKGLEAVAFLEEKDYRPDIIIVDLGLPDIPGASLIHRIHCRHPEIPILVLSVLSSEKDVLDAIRAGAKGYILKEDQESTIVTSLIEFLKGNYPISAGLAHHLFKLAGKAERPEDIGSFTKRELEVLECISQGMSYNEVAASLNISLATVQTYIRSLYKKLDAHSQVQAITSARKRGLIAL